MIRTTPSDPNWLQLAYETLDTGGIVLHPTSTAYGLAVDALNEDAIDRLKSICRRNDKPFILLVRSIEDAKKYAKVNERAEELMKKYWPGALTIIMTKNESIPYLVTGGGQTVALRADAHEVTRALSAAYPHPYTSTSANPSGGPTPYTVEEALSQFEEGDIDLVIDVGELDRVPASTLVDSTKEELKILRQGTIRL